MEINKEKFKTLIEKGVGVTQYLLLSYLNVDIDIKDILNNAKMAGIVTLMEKQGLVQRIGDKLYNITQKGKLLLDFKPEEVKLQLDKNVNWIDKLYINIEEIIVKNTNKKQHLNQSGKYLKPANAELLKQRIATFFKKFGMYEENKVAKAILKYVNAVTKGEIKYALTILYFIYKEERTGGFKSELLDWMTDEEEISNKPVSIDI